MVDDVVSYELVDQVARITMDDGKVNAMSLQMQSSLHVALDRALDDRAVVLLQGRPGVFSGGFDLATLTAGGSDAIDMVRGGFELSVRLLGHPFPVVMACTGHAVAMGAFLLLSGDERIGSTGEYKITANEVAIGLTMPFAATEILRHRLTPAAFNRAVTVATVFAPEDAVEAGFLDDLAAPGSLVETATARAELAAGLDLDAHAESKRRARRPAIEAIRDGIIADQTAVTI